VSTAPQVDVGHSDTAVDLAIIGGTGFDQFALLEDARPLVVETPYGPPAHPPLLGRMGGIRVAVLNRHGHGSDLRLPPHKVNYQANVWAMAHLGANSLLSVNAVGGIASDSGPGAIVVCDQVLDFTWGRAHTFFDGGESGLRHIDFTLPFDRGFRRQLITAAADAGVEITASGTYAVMQGPRLEAAAEVKWLAMAGATVVGMTIMPEAALAREVGMRCANCSPVANWAAGINDTQAINEDHIHAVLSKGAADVAQICLALAKVLAAGDDPRGG